MRGEDWQQVFYIVGTLGMVAILAFITIAAIIAWKIKIGIARLQANFTRAALSAAFTKQTIKTLLLRRILSFLR